MAVPRPDDELTRLERRLKNGLAPVTVLLGPAPYFRGEALRLALAAIPAGRELRIVDGQTDESDGREINDLRGAGLFGGGTWLVIKRAEKWLAKHGERLLPALDAVAKGCGLIVEASKLDKRYKLGKTLAAHDSYEFRELYAEPFDRSRSPLEAELVRWVGDRARASGVPLTPEAAFVLVSTVGKDPQELVAELQRLREQVGPVTKALRPDDLRGRLVCSFESTPFEFAAAVLDQDRARCLRSLAAMFARGVRDRDGAARDATGVFPFVSSWLFQSLSSVHRGRVLLDQGVPLRDVPARAGVRVFGDRYQQQVQRNPQRRLRRALTLLLDAQRSLRRTGEDPRWLLEQFVARYLGSSA